MTRNVALDEFRKMWTWLYSHPAHDNHYYVKHVAKPEEQWKNDCPMCALSEGQCEECLKLWNKGNGSFCEDPKSPLSKWRSTNKDDPHFRTWYAGKIIDIASKAVPKS